MAEAEAEARRRKRQAWRIAVGLAMQFATAVYGGFFGAGMGVMMLATLGLTQGGDYHRLNALKNLLSIVIAAVAILVFVSGGVVAWLQALVMVPGVALGGYAGVWAAKRVPQNGGARLRRRGRAFPGGLLFRHGLSGRPAGRAGARAVSLSASLAPPRGDPGMVAGGEHVGDRPALELLRPRVVRMFEQPVLKTLMVARELVAHDAGQQPHDGVEQHQRGRLAAGQDVVADRDFLELRARRSPAGRRLRSGRRR